MKKRQNRWIALGLSVMLLLTQTTAWAADPAQTQSPLPDQTQSEEQSVEVEEQVEQPDGQIQTEKLRFDPKKESVDRPNQSRRTAIEEKVGQGVIQSEAEAVEPKLFAADQVITPENGFLTDDAVPPDAVQANRAQGRMFLSGGSTESDLETEEKEFEEYLVKELKSLADSIDVSQFTFYESLEGGIQGAYIRALERNPELFYVSFQVNLEWAGEKVDNLIPIYKYEEAAIERKCNEYEEKIDEILEDYIDPEMSDAEKVLALHDYLVMTTSVDEVDWEHWDEVDWNAERFTAYGALVNRVSASDGYVLAMKALLDRVGIENLYATSESMYHTWNLVRVDGDWYHVDVSWDDVVLEEDFGCDLEGWVFHSLVLLSDEALLGWGYENLSPSLPTCANDQYDEAFWRDVYSGMFYRQGEWHYILNNMIYHTDFNGEGWLLSNMFAHLLWVRNDRIYFSDFLSIWEYPLNRPEVMRELTYVDKDRQEIAGFLIEDDVIQYRVREKEAGSHSLSYLYLDQWDNEPFHIRITPSEVIDGELYYRNDWEELYWIYDTFPVKYGETVFTVSGDFEYSEEVAESMQIEVKEVYDDDIDANVKARCEYNEALGKLLLYINTEDYIDYCWLEITVGDAGGIYLISNDGALGVVSTIQPKASLILPIGGTVQTYQLKPLYCDWWQENPWNVIDWNSVDATASKCWLVGDDSGALSLTSYKILPKQEAVEVKIKASRQMQGQAILKVQLVTDYGPQEYAFPCETAEPGVYLYDYRHGLSTSPYPLGEVLFHQPGLSTEETMPLRMEMMGRQNWILAIDGHLIPQSEMGQVQISGVTAGFQVTKELVSDGSNQYVVIVVEAPEERVSGRFTITKGGKSQTFYVSTAHFPSLYADAEGKQQLDKVELPMFGPAAATVYLKGGVIGEEQVDGKPVDWNQYPSTWSFEEKIRYAIDRAEAEYLPEQKAIKLTLYRDGEAKADRYFALRWKTEQDLEFDWMIECRLINDIYLTPFRLGYDAKESGLSQIELYESETDYFMISDQDGTVSDFRIIPSPGSSFQAVKTQLAGYPALRISGGGEAMADPQSITLELPTGERSTFPVSIQADTLKVYFDEQLTHQVKSLTLAQGEEITLYARLEDMVPEEDFVYRWSIDDRQTGAYLIREKYQLEENEDGALLKIPIKAGDTAMPWPGKLNLKFFYRKTYMGDDIDIGLPYQVVPADQTAASGIFNLDLASGRMYALNEHSDAAWVRSNIASKDYTCELIGTNGKELADEESVGTGCRILLKNAQGNTAKALDVLLYGDCTGDGSINVFDLLAVKSKILGISTLQGVYAEAADTARENEGIDIFDLLVLKSHILGISSIQQNPEKS